MRPHSVLALGLTVASCAKGGAHEAPVADSGPMADASCGDLCDADADGVPDHMDQCPATPAGEKVNKVGCADSQLMPTLETMFPPFGLAWTHGGDPGRAGGLTWTYAGINHGDLFHIWWIVCDDPATPCGVSLDASTIAASEYWQFDAADSNLAGGKLVETNATQIALADGTMPAVTGRLTVTITDGASAPVPIAAVADLKVPARQGAYGAEITGAAFNVVVLIEAQQMGTTTWTPYLDYYDAAPTPTTGGSTAVSFGGSFYAK